MAIAHDLVQPDAAIDRHKQRPLADARRLRMRRHRRVQQLIPHPHNLRLRPLPVQPHTLQNPGSQISDGATAQRHRLLARGQVDAPPLRQHLSASLWIIRSGGAVRGHTRMPRFLSTAVRRWLGVVHPGATLCMPGAGNVGFDRMATEKALPPPRDRSKPRCSASHVRRTAQRKIRLLTRDWTG
jgi:hypothetical protein